MTIQWKIQDQKLFKRFLTIMALVFVAACCEGIATWSIKEGYLKKDIRYLTIALLFFAGVTWVFFNVYHLENMSIVNAYYNAFSFLLITSIGVYFFEEKLSVCQKIGLALIFSGVVLISADELGKCGLWGMK